MKLSLTEMMIHVAIWSFCLGMATAVILMKGLL